MALTADALATGRTRWRIRCDPIRAGDDQLRRSRHPPRLQHAESDDRRAEEASRQRPDHHEHRKRLGPLLARRAAYGYSAGALSRRHPGKVVPA